jgi:hypothetical protein
VNKDKFEPIGNNAGTVRDDFCTGLGDIHYLAFRDRLAAERDPRTLVPNSSNLSMLFFWPHGTFPATN